MNAVFYVLSICLLSCPFSVVLAQDVSEEKNTTISKPVLRAIKVSKTPVIDGLLDEEMWLQAPTATDFLDYQPKAGIKASQQTHVRVLYDNEAIYIGAYLYDTAPDSIMRQLGLRDTWGLNADHFEVDFDTYNDDQNAFGFRVSASNVQSDIRYSPNSEDINWSAVWKSRARIVNDGWIAEIKIPHSALRFPQKSAKTWGINFTREIRRHRELATWSGFDPSKQGFVLQFGDLEGITGIEPPLRLALIPYASAYSEFYTDPNNAEENANRQFFRGGLDLKYGINESFTLDMGLIPDFGQVRSDDQILNTSPFEVQFNENRPFFMEGTELFLKAGIFYSRRIGGRPIGYYNLGDKLSEGETVIENPTEVQLYNISKISGRTKGKMGIGVLNALTGAAFATVQDQDGQKRQIETAPLSNYNVLVLDQSLRNGGFVSLTNTNVMRSGTWRDANTTAVKWNIVDKKNKYGFQGLGSLSQVFENNQVQRGYKYYWELGKISGNALYGAWQNLESDQYNPNDLGYLQNPNEITSALFFRYSHFKGFGRVTRLFSGSEINYSTLYKPIDYEWQDSTVYKPSRFQYFNWSNWVTFNFKNNMAVGGNLNFSPAKGYDYFEPRTEGRFVRGGQAMDANIWVSTNYSKKFAIDADMGTWQSNLYQNQYYWGGVSPRYRPNDKWMFIYRLSFNGTPHTPNYATTDGTQVIYGFRREDIINNTLEVAYNFSSKMSINCRLRHYWARLLYKDYHLLMPNGYLSEQALQQDYKADVSFNAFNINWVYTWQFAPGSELSLVWKDEIFDYDSAENLQEYEQLTQRGYLGNLKNLFGSPQTNSISLRVLYYLDWQSFKKN